MLVVERMDFIRFYRKIIIIKQRSCRECCLKVVYGTGSKQLVYNKVMSVVERMDFMRSLQKINHNKSAS